MEQDNLTDAKQRPNTKAVCCTSDCYLVENDVPPARCDILTADQPSTDDMKVIRCLPAIFEAIRGSLPPQRSQETTSDFSSGLPVDWQQQPTFQLTQCNTVR